MKTWYFASLALLPAHAEQPNTADLAKLRDPSRREEEIRRLANVSEDENLTSYRLLTATQRTGSPLIILSAAADFQSSINLGLQTKYEVENPEGLFRAGTVPDRVQLEPTLEPVRDSVLFVLDENGKEIQPFDGDNYTERGYYYDFDRDGILDRADFSHYGLEQVPDTTITAFTLQTFERSPRTLLTVIYNWHPDSADDANEWTYSCFDENKDGVPEIAFGPANAPSDAEQRQIVFRWDLTSRSFQPGDHPDRAHVRALQAGETLMSIAKSGGLGYPLLKGSGTSGSDEGPPPSPGGPYVFSTLKGRSDQELAAFFQGKKLRDSWERPEDSFPNRLPDDFTKLAPKMLALALAEENRTPSHRRIHQLAVDDRNGVRPPESGWLLNNWGSSLSYSYSSRLCALNFGVNAPTLYVFGSNRIGVVGQNPWADQPAYSVRIIQLKEEEARFIADTVFWLDRLRSHTVRKRQNWRFTHSSADGFASVSLLPDRGIPREMTSGKVWAGRSISDKWEDDYTQETFVNLTQLFIDQGLPAMLGDRWKTAADIDPLSLRVPIDQRLKPRIDADARGELEKSYTSILEHHASHPVPAHVLAEIVRSAGDEGLTRLTPLLRNLLTTLPPENDEDREFAALESRFENHHNLDLDHEESAEELQARHRFGELTRKRKFLPAAILRQPLVTSISRLAMAEDPSALRNAAASNGPDSIWALRLLRRSALSAWAQIIESRLQDADAESRPELFSTLAAGHPPTARRILENLSPKGKAALIIEITRFHETDDPSALTHDIPLLLDLVRDRKQDFIRRGEAMDGLARCPLSRDQLSEFAALIAREIQNPQEGEYGMSTLDSATHAAGRLPRASVPVEWLVQTPAVSLDAFDEGVEAIASLTDQSEKRSTFLTDFLRPRFETSRGLMDHVFLTALAFDLRTLKEKIAAMATESPEVSDGDGSNYSGGGFKGPAGQRYHLAREITALWSETDPVTVARMWVFFALAHPAQFDLDYNHSKRATVLRELAAAHIRQLPADCRLATVNAAVSSAPVPPNHPNVETWLRSLCQ
ncbi:MAG: hypothetical protein ACKV19_14445 [Verrucomicrobiales bacterium]